MKYYVNVTKGFSSAHALRNYKGKCERLHGHNWKVELTLEGRKLGKSGMMVDFVDVKDMLERVLSHLDHRFLNETAPFNRVNPTAENIAAFIFSSVKKELKKLKAAAVKVSSVKVWESDSTWAQVTGER